MLSALSALSALSVVSAEVAMSPPSRPPWSFCAVVPVLEGVLTSFYIREHRNLFRNLVSI
jgi:hypothetical protein